MGYSGIRIYSGMYSGMEIQVFRNENSSQTNAYSHYSNYSYSGLIPNERALIPVFIAIEFFFNFNISNRTKVLKNVYGKMPLKYSNNALCFCLTKMLEKMLA